MKQPSSAGHLGFWSVVLLLAAVLLATQPLASAHEWAPLNVLAPILDAPAWQSPVYAGLALAGLILATFLVWLRSLDPYAARRPRGLVFTLALAPGLLGASMLYAYDRATGGPSVIGLAGAPIALLAPPIVLLSLEAIAHGIAARIARTAGRHDWRASGSRAGLFCLRLKPADPEMRQACGLLLASEDRYAPAARLLERADPAGEADQIARLQALERCYRGLGRREAAVACLEQLVALTPDSRAQLNRLLEDYLALDRLEDALALLDAHQLKEAFARLKLREGLQVRLGRLDAALETIQKIEALEGAPHTLTIQFYRELLALAPERGDVRIRLGGLLLEGDKREARDEGARLLEGVVAADPDGQDPLRARLLEFYRESDDFPRMRPHLEALVRAGTREPAHYLTLAQILQRDHEPEKAADALERMTRALPENWQGYVRLARLRLGQERIDEAEAALARADACAGEEGAPSVEHLRNDLANWRRERNIASIRAELAGDGRDIAKRLDLIDALIDSERIDEVLANCEALLETHPEAMEDLEAHLEAGIKRTETNYRLSDYLSDLYFRQERYDDLLQLYRIMSSKALEPTRTMIDGCRRILAAQPDHLASRQDLALAQREREDWPGVIEALDPLVAGLLAEPADPITPPGEAAAPAVEAEDRALWVEAAYRVGRLEDARRVGLTVVHELAAEIGFMLLMIDILRELDDHAGAYRIYELAHEASPGDPRLVRLARRIDYDRKRQRLGELEARPIDDLTPEEHYEKAGLHGEFGEIEQAIVHYQRAAHDPELEQPALGHMAVAMCERGMYDLAAETLEPMELKRESVALHPELKQMFYDVAFAMERHKRYDRALTLYKRIFRVDAAFRDVVDKLQRFG